MDKLELFVKWVASKLEKYPPGATMYLDGHEISTHKYYNEVLSDVEVFVDDLEEGELDKDFEVWGVPPSKQVRVLDDTILCPYCNLPMVKTRNGVVCTTNGCYLNGDLTSWEELNEKQEQEILVRRNCYIIVPKMCYKCGKLLTCHIVDEETFLYCNNPECDNFQKELKHKISSDGEVEVIEDGR